MKPAKLSNPTKKSHHHEPLIHITKREQMAWKKAWLIRAIAIFLALIVSGGIIMLLTGLNPVDVFVEMFKGNFEISKLRWSLLKETAILLCISLAVTPAFKMKFWNCGAEGQVLAGCIGAAACMIYFGETLPSWAIIVLSFITAMIAGAMWAVIPAIFKAHYDTNETLFTLMMNYIVIEIVKTLQVVWENPKNSGNVGVINRQTEAGWLPKILGSRYTLIIVIVAIVCVLIHIYLKHSKQGYEISVVGESQNTARYVGINVKKVIIRTMILSGIICGLTGFLLVNGSGQTIGPNTVGGQGFTAILVSWMAKFNPIAMILTSALIIFLKLGATAISTSFGFDAGLSDIITGIILFFIIGCEFFIQYEIHFRRSKKGVAEE